MIELNPQTLFIVISCVAIASFIHGYSGFGFGIISVTAFSLTSFNLERAAAIINLLNPMLMIALFIAGRNHSQIQWRHVWVLCFGAFLGQPIGYWLLLKFHEMPEFRLVVGCLFIYYGINGFWSIQAHHPLRRVWGFFLGALGGLIGGAMVSGGPPMIYYLYSQTRDPRDMKGIIQVVFLITTLFRLNLVRIQGDGFPTPLLLSALSALPVVVTLILLGHYLSRHGSVLTFKRCVYSLLVFFGVVVISKSMMIIIS